MIPPNTWGFRHSMRNLSPPWLQRLWGARYMYPPGLVLDLIAEWAIEGVIARFPEIPWREDHLGMLGRDRVITRGFAEPARNYKIRLRRWLDSHRGRGNAFALMEQVRDYLTGYPVRIRCVNDRGTWQTIHPDGSYEVHRKQGNWDWDGFFPAQAKTRWWMIIYPLDTGLWTTEGKWGEGGVRWGDPGTWGTSATREQVDTIKHLVSDEGWAPFGARCQYVIIAFDENSFDPTDPAGAPLPDGTWRYAGKSDGGVYKRARLSTARYWRMVP